MKHLLGVRVTGEAIGYFVRSGLRELSISVDSPIPHGAKFCHSWYDYLEACFVVVFEHDSFEATPDGCPIPISSSSVTITNQESNKPPAPDTEKHKARIINVAGSDTIDRAEG